MSTMDIKIKKKATLPQYFKGLFMASKSTLAGKQDLELTENNMSMDRAPPIHLPRYVPHYTVNSDFLSNNGIIDEPVKGDTAPIISRQQQQKQHQQPKQKPVQRRAKESKRCGRECLGGVIFCLYLIGSASINLGLEFYLTLKTAAKENPDSNNITTSKLSTTTKLLYSTTKSVHATTTIKSTSNSSSTAKSDFNMTSIPGDKISLTNSHKEEMVTSTTGHRMTSTANDRMTSTYSNSTSLLLISNILSTSGLNVITTTSNSVTASLMILTTKILPSPSTFYMSSTIVAELISTTTASAVDLSTNAELSTGLQSTSNATRVG